MEPNDPVKYVDCTPRLSPEQYLDIFDTNMACLRKEFGPGWTRTKKINTVASRYAFIKHWYELLEADLHILDYVNRARGDGREHLPGVITSFVISPEKSGKWGICLLIQGKPFEPAQKDNLKTEIQRLLDNKGDKFYRYPELRKHIEYYLRDQGYEVLDVQETVEIEV